MKPELRRVVWRLVIGGFAFAIVLAIARMHPADFEAPGLKFVSREFLENSQRTHYIGAMSSGVYFGDEDRRTAGDRCRREREDNSRGEGG
jgi:hypothetical protein